MAMKRIAPVLVFCASVLIWSPPVAVSAEVQTTAPAVEEDETTEAQAIRFRQSFGLRADLAFVRAARQDKVNFSSEPYGVPLTEAEIAELLRRGRIQVEMEAAIQQARTMDSFAGAYLDQHDGGRPVFLFTNAHNGLVDQLGRLFKEETTVRIELASHTEKQLADRKSRMVADMPSLAREGIEVVRVALTDRLNTLEIGVHGLTTTSEAILKDRYGPELIVFEDDIAQSDVCDASNNCRPMKGAIAINHTGGPAGECTSGWVVKRNDTGAIALVTAGHCIQTHGGFDQAWQHNSDGFGRALRETWIPGGSGEADVGLITIQSPELAIMTQKNQMRRTNGSVTNVTSLGSVVQGGQACRVGFKSGHDCGVINNTDVARLSSVPGYSAMTVTRTTTWNEDSLEGDSGGSVFYYGSGAGGGPECCGPVRALGTHVHSEEGTGANESWFSSQFWGSWDYTSIWGYSYSICLTTSC